MLLDKTQAGLVADCELPRAVGLRPLPRLPLKSPASGTRSAGPFPLGHGAAVLPQVRRSFPPPGAVRPLQRTWRISNSYSAISANDGHAAISRPAAVGSATATLAARLATLPTKQATPTAETRHDYQNADQPAAWWKQPRSSRPPRTG
jgi:hypothetical protein